MTPTQPRHTTLLFLLSLLVPLLLAAVACDAISNKPSPEISGDAYNSVDTLWAACQERAWEIDDWEDNEDRKLEDAWIDGEALDQVVADGWRLQEEADNIKSDLLDNCQAAADQEFNTSITFPGFSPRPSER